MKKLYKAPKARLIELTEKTSLLVDSNGNPSIDGTEPYNPENGTGVLSKKNMNMINGIVWFETEED